jgi:uncharacterized membrane protein YqhA
MFPRLGVYCTVASATKGSSGGGDVGQPCNSRLTADAEGDAMLQYALSLRLIVLAGSLGAMLGALLMFVQGGARITAAIEAVAAADDPKLVTGSVMGATDAFLFGIVLVIFAYAFAFGFAFDLSPETRERLPPWMRINRVSDLKHTLIEVILVYLVVDFATDWAQASVELSWVTLVKPLSIVLIAAASRLYSANPPDPPQR